MTLKELLQRHTVMKCLLLALALLGSIARVHELISPFMKVALALGFALVLWDVIKRRFDLADPGFWLLVAFAALYALSAFVNGGDEAMRSVKDILYMVLLFALLYCGQKGTDRDLLVRERIVLARAALVMMLAMIAACLAVYMIFPASTYTVSDGTVGYIGSLDGRLCGLVHMNVIGGICGLAMILAAGMVVMGARGLWRIAAALTIALAAAALALSRSRTAILALAAALVFALVRFVLVPRLGAGTKKKLARTAGILICLAIGVGAGFFAYHAFVGEADAAVARLVALGDSVLTGRASIWAEGLRLFAQHPLLGVTAQHFSATAVVDIPYSWNGGGIHSLFFAVPVYSGLAGCVLLTAFTAYRVARIRRAGRAVSSVNGADPSDPSAQAADSQAPSFAQAADKPAPRDASAALCSVMICFLLAQGLTEVYLLYSLSFFAVAFWLCMGIRKEG